MDFSDLVALKIKELMKEKNINSNQLSKLTGIYSYNADTGAITSARNPTLSIDYANFGAAWIAYMNNVSTSYTITGTKSIKFTGKYHMYGQCSPPGFDGASFTKDFRSHTVSFTSNE